MKLVLHIWRQKNPKAAGKLARYELGSVSEHMSFLEMLDVLNEELTAKGDDPVAFDHERPQDVHLVARRGGRQR